MKPKMNLGRLKSLNSTHDKTSSGQSKPGSSSSLVKHCIKEHKKMAKAARSKRIFGSKFGKKK